MSDPTESTTNETASEVHLTPSRRCITHGEAYLACEGGGSAADRNRHSEQLCAELQRSRPVDPSWAPAQLKAQPSPNAEITYPLCSRNAGMCGCDESVRQVVS